MNDFRVTVITEIVTDHEVKQCDILSCEAEEDG